MGCIMFKEYGVTKRVLTNQRSNKAATKLMLAKTKFLHNFVVQKFHFCKQATALFAKVRFLCKPCAYIRFCKQTSTIYFFARIKLT